MTVLRSACATLALLTVQALAGGAAAAHAQTVHGRVLDSQGQPVPAALLTLLDAQGRTVATGLSGDAGAFALTAGAAGRFTIRVERIGFEAQTGAPFDLAADERRVLTVTVAAAPVVLAEIRAEGASRCVTRPEDGGPIARLWDEARKGLRITAAAEAGGAVPSRGVHYTRELDASARRQTSVRSRRDFTTTGIPFDAIPGSILASAGFAVTDDDGEMSFFGPSAAVLLSDPFLERHCFNRIVVDRAQPGMVGLGFEPVRGSGIVGIAGTMWLDRATARLTRVEYSYRAPARNVIDSASGRIDFITLRSGIPLVSRWWIRMPMVLETARRQGDVPRVVALLEEGGIVLDAAGTAINAGDEILASLDAAAAADDRLQSRRVERAALDSIAARGGSAEDALRRLGDVVRIERGRFWSYDHGEEDILCVEAPSPLPRSTVAVGGVPQAGVFCEALLVYLDGAPLEAPGLLLRHAPAARFATIEWLGAARAAERLGTPTDEPVLLLTSH